MGGQLGRERRVVRLEGEDGGTGVELRLAALALDGDRQGRRGQGAPRVGRPGRGDQVIEFKVEIPKKLHPREAELLRNIAAELEEDVKEPRRGLFSRLKK